MSFTTRCPACGTVFRVVADQLKISDGWVRCGHCADVFDATIHLEAWAPAAAAPVAVPPPAPGPVSAAPPPTAEPAPMPAAPTPAPAPVDTPSVPDDDDPKAWFGDGPLEPAATAQSVPPAAEPPATESPVAAPPSAAPAPSPRDAGEDDDGVERRAPSDWPDSIQPPDALAVPSVLQTLAVESREGPESDFHAELERFAHSSRAPLVPEAPPADGDSDASPAAPAPPAPASEAPMDSRPPADADAPDAEPGFVRQARRRAFWSSPGVRVVLVLVALLLAALLAGQWAIQQRHRLVAAQPALKPLIVQACGWLGCDLAPVRRIDAIVIDSAELVRRLGNFHSFDLVLHNQSPLEVALPALELTLTDPNGLVISRRVFLPQDWPVETAALPPGGRLSVSFRLSISLGEGVPTAGYRALVFYP